MDYNLCLLNDGDNNHYIQQVNEKFYKLERVYRDCIKMTRDKTRIYSILHDAPGA